MQLDIPSLIHQFSPSMFVKVVFLIILFLYAIFAFIIFNQIQSLNKIIFIRPFHATRVVQALAVLYFLLTISLFFYSLVIL